MQVSIFCCKIYLNQLQVIFYLGGDGMLSISICVGSACYLKGSYDVIKSLQALVEINKLDTIVEIKGSFCLGNCTHGVSVKLNDEEKVYSVTQNNVDQFFKNEILRRVQN